MSHIIPQWACEEPWSSSRTTATGSTFPPGRFSRTRLFQEISAFLITRAGPFPLDEDKIKRNVYYQHIPRKSGLASKSLDFNWDNNSSGISNPALYVFGYLKTILGQVSSLSQSSSSFPFWQLLLVNKFSRALSSHCLLPRNLLKTCPLVESSQ